MTIIQSIILGIVEGVTEFLPVSSTGHMILASRLMGIANSPFLESFEIIIQFGSILAVVVLYWKKLFASRETLKKVALAFIPTAIIGFLLYKILKTYFLGNVALVLWSLFLGGVILIAFEWWHKKYGRVGVAEVSQITYKKSFWTGVWQSLAIIPGVSRSGATIVGGMAMGISREAIVEFSFLLAIPTMAAATGYDFLKSAHSFTGSQMVLLAVGFVTAFVVALLAIKWFISFVQNHSFTSFGIYRIAIALIFWLFLIK